MFFSLLNQIKWFLCHWTCKLEGYKCSLNVKIKKQHRKHRKRMSDALFQKIWKISFRPISSFSPLSSSLLICFEWFKTGWVHQLGLYKISLNSRSKDATIKDCKLENNSFIKQHWTPLHQTPHIFPIPLLNADIFAVLKVLGGGIQMLFELQKQSNNVWGFDLPFNA
jgi:hypothetical protein